MSRQSVLAFSVLLAGAPLVGSIRRRPGDSPCREVGEEVSRSFELAGREGKLCLEQVSTGCDADEKSWLEMSRDGRPLWAYSTSGEFAACRVFEPGWAVVLVWRPSAFLPPDSAEHLRDLHGVVLDDSGRERCSWLSAASWSGSMCEDYASAPIPRVALSDDKSHVVLWSSIHNWTSIRLDDFRKQPFSISAVAARALDVLDVVAIRGTGLFLVHVVEWDRPGSGADITFRPVVHVIDGLGTVLNTQRNVGLYKSPSSGPGTADPRSEMRALIRDGKLPQVGSDTERTFWVGLDGNECRLMFGVTPLGPAEGADALTAVSVRPIGFECP